MSNFDVGNAYSTTANFQANSNKLLIARDDHGLLRGVKDSQRAHPGM